MRWQATYCKLTYFLHCTFLTIISIMNIHDFLFFFAIRGRKLTVVSSAEPGSPTEMVSSNTKSSIAAQRKSSLLRARLSSRNAQGLLQLLQAMPASKKKLLSPSFQNWYLLKLQLHHSHLSHHPTGPLP